MNYAAYTALPKKAYRLRIFFTNSGMIGPLFFGRKPPDFSVVIELELMASFSSDCEGRRPRVGSDAPELKSKDFLPKKRGGLVSLALG